MAARRFSNVFRVETLSVVLNGHCKTSILFDQPEFDMGGAGVFSDIGKAFLQDKNHLELLFLRRQEQTVFPGGFDRYPGLLCKAGE